MADTLNDIGPVLIANRGEIAARVIRTCRRLQIPTVVVYSDADADLPYVALADEAIRIGGPRAVDSYLKSEAILEAADRSGARSVHPGYGFLSENADFARAVESAGLTWIGPTADTIDAVGDKINARNTMRAANVPTLGGSSEALVDADAATTTAAEIGYPVMLKPAAGGGGHGMIVAENEAELRSTFVAAQRRAEQLFGNARILLERYVKRARHVEVQILGLADGRIAVLGDRDCSVQRRHQKIAEESPAPELSDRLRRELHDSARAAATRIGYRNAGTIECLVDVDRDSFYFLEVNARLQVEHPVTEEVFGIDLVEAQLRVAAGQLPQFDVERLTPAWHALELRVYAEDPTNFLPGPGVLTSFDLPSGEGIRIDTGFAVGSEVTRHYDPMIAKLIVSGSTRDEVIDRARRALAECRISGPSSNVEFLSRLVTNEAFARGVYDTGLVEAMRAAPEPSTR